MAKTKHWGESNILVLHFAVLFYVNMTEDTEGLYLNLVFSLIVNEPKYVQIW